MTISISKTVSFSNVVKAKKVPHLSDIPLHEKACIWYDEDDFTRIAEENRQAIVQVLTNNSDEEPDTRGLENLIQIGASNRKLKCDTGGKKGSLFRDVQNPLIFSKKTYTTRFNVMKEQRQEKEQGKTQLAETSVKCSLASVMAARAMGIHDEIEARDIYEEKGTACSTSTTKKDLQILGDVEECLQRASNLRDRRRQRMRQIACKAA